jgi:predicted AlkP superfamily pyrophosphatase or phosphodiesterase
MENKRISLFMIVLFGILSISLQAQDNPRLIVGITVDQMRMDYIYRFAHRFGDDGFKRLMREGYTFHNAHFNYVPTSTAPGHASIYTGTTPAYHGIVGNSWFDQQLNETVYCAYDGDYESVGTENDNGKMSPHQLLATTFTDQLLLHSSQSKVIGISIKDRGAVFPAGHLGKAYWYDAETGNFISSTYYHEEDLPRWVNQFNRQELSAKFTEEVWETAEPIETYTASGPDESPYEGGLLGKRTFPYDLSQVEGYAILPSTPFGNDILTALAIHALEKADMGDDEYADVLSVSYSSPDYIGHNFGPRSVEVEDTYIRLDRNIAELLSKLDEEIGQGNYTVFLTADHAVSDVPKYLMDNNMPGGYFRLDLQTALQAWFEKWLGEGAWIRNISNYQVFLNRDLLNEKQIDLAEVRARTASFLLGFDGIAATYTAEELISGSYTDGGFKGLYIRGYSQKRSGDVAFAFEPGWLASGRDFGTSHGSGYKYDTHVPMIFFGNGVRAGRSYQYHTITDIAPTMSGILGITVPNAATGEILEEVFETGNRE